MTNHPEAISPADAEEKDAHRRQAKSLITLGVVGAIASVMKMGFAMVFYTVSPEMIFGRAVIAAVLAFLAFGLLRKSRVCAAILLAYALLAVVLTANRSPWSLWWLLEIAIAWFQVQGLRGALLHAQLKK